MRLLAIPTLFVLLAAPVLADEAADLFYRAFWLEQSGTRAAEAEKLYKELIEKHADAPEAPRAYLALIRMNAARGAAVDALLEALEKAYPEASEEIERARRIVARVDVEFDATDRPDDAPLDRKLKTIYTGLQATGEIAKADQEFLADVGVAAHPMLAAALRSSSGDAVFSAASVLVAQHSEQADAVLLAALQDESVLYRLRILDPMYRTKIRGELAGALNELWPRASRSMRVRIARIWAGQTRMNDSIRTSCFEYLARALRDESEEVRVAALACNYQPPYELPEAWTKAALQLVPSDDSRVSAIDRLLPWQVRHEKLRPTVEKALIEREGRIWFFYPRTPDLESHDITEAMAESWVRIALARSARDPSILESNAQDDTKGLVWSATRVSAPAARRVLEAGLQRGDVNLLAQVRNARQRSDLGDLGELKARALEQWYAEDENRRKAASLLLGYAHLEKADFPAVLAAVKNHPGKGLPARARASSFLKAIGPADAARLVPLATDDEISTLLASGMVFLGSAEDDGLVFFEAILPRTRPNEAVLLRQLAVHNTRLDQAVARRLLETQGADWKWRTAKSEPQQFNVGAPGMLSNRAIQAALRSDALRPALYRAVADPRYELARFALEVAAGDESVAGLAALPEATRSPWSELRERAVKLLGRRGPKGAAVLVVLLEKPEFPAELRKEALTQLSRCAGAEQLSYVRARLDARPGGHEASVLWDIAFRLDKEATIERAFREVFGEGPDAYRSEALDVLRKTSDERRIPFFRKVLREDSNEVHVHRVLNTVADQYLIELGAEVLLHLRNPNDGIRKTATKAIERLRFYAEAKKLFDEGK